jgi:hypothetical protein
MCSEDPRRSIVSYLRYLLQNPIHFFHCNMSINIHIWKRRNYFVYGKDVLDVDCQTQGRLKLMIEVSEKSVINSTLPHKRA